MSITWPYPARVTTDDTIDLLADASDWAEFLTGEALPGSDDLYTVQIMKKLMGAVQRLVDERDSLHIILDRKRER